MKPWFSKDADLLFLHNSIQKYMGSYVGAQKKPLTVSSKQAPDEASQSHAAKKIQHLWRGYKVKETFVKDPYGAYLSMIDPLDEQRLLSSIMFGRHEAELHKGSKDRVTNPYIHDQAAYHRCDNLTGSLLLTQLQQEFNITPAMLKGKSMIPVTELKTVSIEDTLKEYKNNGYTILRKPNASIAIVLAPNQSQAQYYPLRNQLVSAGLIASPWEIAQHISVKTKATTAPVNDVPKIKGLPNTKEELLASNLFRRLNQVAQNKARPTHHLASSIIQLLKNDDALTPDAIARIASILDMANTFYSNNYPRYAFCVYAIIHELSLSIAKQTDPTQLDASYERFLAESKESLTQSLGLDESELTQSIFIAAPAMSGTNAFMIAKRLASCIKTESGRPPTIKQYDPCYFELHMDEFKKTLSFDADIFLFSTGPIVSPEGLTPGVDINTFVRDKVIKRGRTKPATLIIDTTTTLYKNLHLDPDVKKLVQDGKLSIIAFESHQKFGLLHTDQAQYGRMFSCCAKGMFDEAKLQQLQEDAKSDFRQHMDLRVGANINHCCNNTLEEIKQQHFKNGSIFSNILKQANLISDHIVQHDNMLQDLDELYFSVPSSSWSWNNLVDRILPGRNSFGHYKTTLSAVVTLARLCPNASDGIDSLILSTQIYLALKQPEKYNALLQQHPDFHNLTEAEQIVCIALANNLINSPKGTSPADPIKRIQHYCQLSTMLNAVPSLKGRESYEELSRYLSNLKKEIITENETASMNPDFLRAVQIAYNNKINLSKEQVAYLKLSPSLCTIIAADVVQLNNEFIKEWAGHPEKLKQIVAHKDCFVQHAELFKTLNSSGIYLDAGTLASLTTNKEAPLAVQQLIAQKFPLNSDNIKLINNKAIVTFINNNSSLTTESISTLAMLDSFGVEIDDVTFNLAKTDHQFCSLLSLVNDTNSKILAHLKSHAGDGRRSQEKYTESVQYTPTYIQETFQAIKTYRAEPSKMTKEKLIKSIYAADDKYCNTVLYKVRTKSEQVLRGILKGFYILLIAIINGPNEAKKAFNGRLLKKTTSEEEIETMETQLKRSL